MRIGRDRLRRLETFWQLLYITMSACSDTVSSKSRGKRKAGSEDTPISGAALATASGSTKRARTAKSTKAKTSSKTNGVPPWPEYFDSVSPQRWMQSRIQLFIH